jgi:hypothetical protein
MHFIFLGVLRPFEQRPSACCSTQNSHKVTALPHLPLIWRLSALLSRVDEPPYAIREQNVDLLRLDHCGNFAQAESWMHHRLPLAVGSRPIITWALSHLRTLAPYALAALKGAARSALWAAHSRDLTFYIE